MTTQRWNDEMLDRLANTVDNLSERVSDLSESVEQTNHNLDILIGAVNALIERDNQRALEIQQLRQESEAYRRKNDLEIQQLRQESETYRRENDQRFNTVLEEIRFLVRRLGNEPNS